MKFKGRGNSSKPLPLYPFRQTIVAPKAGRPKEQHADEEADLPPVRSFWGGAPPPGGEAPSVVDLVMSVRVFTLNPKRSGYSLTARSALFPRLQPCLNLFQLVLTPGFKIY